MEFLIPLIILLFSAVLHELAHGIVADRLGDPTPRLAGRLTLNPIPHLDPIMSVALPALLVFSGSPIIFGSAKPVPINPIHFKDPKKDMALTALAGPLTNILILVIASQLLKFIPISYTLSPILYMVVLYNLMLAIINLIPIPPLDGSKIIASFLPSETAYSYLSIERYGIFILFFLLMFPIGGFSLSNIISNLSIFSLKLLGI